MNPLLDRFFFECAESLASYSGDIQELFREAIVAIRPVCYRVEELRSKWELPLQSVVLKMAKAPHALVVEEDPKQAAIFCEEAIEALNPYVSQFHLNDQLSALEDFHYLCVTSDTALVVWPVY